MRRLLLTLLGCVVASAAIAQPSPDPAKELTASEIPGVIAAGTKVQFLRAGFNGTEGVIAMPDGSVLFCELNADKIIHLDLNGNFTTYLESANRTIGLAYDRKGRLIGAQSRDPRIGVLAPVRATLAESFEGQPLVRPNDLVVDRKGGIYFSDPLPTAQTQFRDPPLGRKPLLFYITPKGKTTKLTDEIARPNGVQLSKNEKIFYAVDGNSLVAFDVQPNGTVRNPRKFADATGDGLAVDNEDRVYVATEQGIRVLSASGQMLGLIPTPVAMQSIAFAGADRRTLYAAGRGAIYRITLLAQGIKGRAK